MPAGWDSWGLIGALRAKFDFESISKGDPQSVLEIFKSVVSVGEQTANVCF